MGIIRVAAAMPAMGNDTKTIPTRIYLPSFPLIFRFENLRESKGILLTINNDRETVRIISNRGEGGI